MKTQLIILEQGNIIVSDEEIKQRDLLIWKNEIHRYHSDAGYGLKTYTDYSEKEGSSLVLNWSNLLGKLIASDNLEHNLPIIDYNGLEEKFGIVDVEKLAKISGYWRLNNKYAFIEGFKKAQSFNDKKFSLEDVIGAMRHIFNQEVFYGKTIEETLKMRDKSMFDYIKFLQQPKVFDIEVEMEVWNQKGNITSLSTLKPKITNNSIKITKVL